MRWNKPHPEKQLHVAIVFMIQPILAGGHVGASGLAEVTMLHEPYFRNILPT